MCMYACVYMRDCARVYTSVYFFRMYRVLRKKHHHKMFVNQHGCVKMTSYSHDIIEMTFHRENGRMRLFKTF